MGAVGQLHLGVAIDGFGQHPAAWQGRNDGAALLDAGTYVDRARRAEQGLFDFVLLDDSLVCDSSRPVPLQGRLDALLTMARVAPSTSRVGLVASVNTTHTEPFNVAKNVATLDWVSQGRAGWRPVIAADSAEYAQFGRREPLPDATLYAEAADVVDVVGRLSDSWEDDAIIRDRPTGRYIDRDKVHYVDFEGAFFRVRGPSITPRSPQAQALVVIDDEAGDVAPTWADAILIDAPAPPAAAARRAVLRATAEARGRPSGETFVLARIEVLLGDPAAGTGSVSSAAQAEAAALEAVRPWPRRDERLRFVGSAEDLAALFVEWAPADAVDGFVVLPARLPVDLDRFVAGVVPALGRADVFRTAYTGSQLREHFGLSRPANRYAASAART